MKDSMSVLATDDRQLILIYNGETSLGKQTLGYAEAAGDKVQTVDICKTKLGDTVWVSIADGLDMPLKSILDLDHPDAPDVKDADMSTDDWLKMLQHNPVLLQQPVAINGKKFMKVTTPSELLKFFDVDTAGLKQHPKGENPETKPSSEDDSFVKK